MIKSVELQQCILSITLREITYAGTFQSLRCTYALVLQPFIHPTFLDDM